MNNIPHESYNNNNYNDNTNNNNETRNVSARNRRFGASSAIIKGLTIKVLHEMGKNN